MTTHRVRASSPSAPRIYLEAPRASTGTILTSTYNTRYDQQPPRASFSALPSTSTSTATQSSSRNNSVYETAQPVSKRTYHDPTHSGGTISRTEYAIRPRRDSNTAENRRPANITTKNLSPTREKLDKYDSPRDMVPYAKASRDDTTRLRPTHTQGSAHHQRHNSATRAETSRHSLGPEARRAEREYHKRGPYVEKVADSRPPPSVARYAQDPTFEYTGPREQFDRDYPATRPRRESLTRRERPNSAIGTKFEQVPSRRETAPPPSASRQLQRIERDERKSGFESDPERSREPRPRERPSSHPMKSAVVHQRDDGYSSARDDYDSRRPVRRPHEDDVSIASSKSRYHDTDRELERERERPRREREREEERPREPARDRDRDRRERRSSKTGDREYERERERPRPREYEVIEEDDSQRRPRRREPRDVRDESPERGSGLKTLATAALGGLAATGVANFKSRKDDEGSDSDSRKGRKHRRRRSRERREDDGHVDEDPEERRRRRRERQAQKDDSSGRERQAEKDDSSGSDTPDDRKRPQSRTRRRRDTQDGYGSDRERALAALTAPPTDRRPSRDPDPDAARSELAREPVPNRAQQASPTNNEGRTLSPGEGDDGRPRRVSIVEPTKKEDIKPKGILKPPRSDPFPEDPNPTREGVAPLKQAGKDGVPSGARWTKVSRILVNPEALERYQERFEERDDYVIVLRVLSREEIEKLAEKTREIRGNTALPYIRDHDQDHSTDYSPQKPANANGRKRSKSVSVVEPSEVTAIPRTKMVTMRAASLGAQSL